MPQHSSKLSLLTTEQRQQAIKAIIDFYETEKDETIGVIAAEELLDMFLDTVGTTLYNKGVDDSKNFIINQFAELETEIEIALKK